MKKEMFFNFNTKKESGISLVELVIAIGLFSVLAVFVTGAFMNIISIQKQTDAKQQIMNDFRISLDLMGREIMAGNAFVDMPDGATILPFATHVRPDMDRRVIHYKVDGGRLLKAQQNTEGTCQVAYDDFSDHCFVPFTSDRVDVTRMTFYVRNFDEDGLGHPIIIITASGEMNVPGVAPTSFQTAVSYSPRSNVNPQIAPPSDTTPPVVEIETINSVPVLEGEGVVNMVDVNQVDIVGRTFDPGGSGIRRIRLHNFANSHIQTKDYFECSPSEEETHRAGVEVVFGTTDSWHDSNWPYRFTITSNPVLVLESNTNLYFDLSKAPLSFWDNVNDDGSDIRVVFQDGTEVAREVSGISKASRRGSLYFDSTGLSTSVETRWHIYYGNPGAAEPLPEWVNGRYNVWDDDYVGVWHFDGGEYGTAIPVSQPNTLFVKMLMSRDQPGVDLDDVTFSGAVSDSNAVLYLAGNSNFSAYGFHTTSVPKQSRVSWEDEVKVISTLLAFRASPSTTAVDRVQHRFSHQSGLVSLTLDDQPIEGNLLIAVLSNRSDGVYPEISGSGWQQVFNTCFSVEGGDCGAQYPYDEMHWHRRGMAVWWKIADSSEPATTTARWLRLDGSSPESVLFIQEFEAIGGTFPSNALDSFVVDNSRTKSVTSFENAFYPPLGAIRDSTRNELHGIAHANSKIQGKTQGRMNTSNLLSGMVGNALSFDGFGDLIRVSDTGTNITGNQFTLSAWVKRNFTCDDTACDNGIISKAHESDPANKERYHLGIRRYGAIDVRRFSGVAGIHRSDFGFGVDLWRHITGIYDGTKLDTFLQGQHAGGELSATGNIDSSADDLLFGGRYDVNSADVINRRFYPGMIDDVRISKVARSPNWIRTEYNNQGVHDSFWIVGVTQGEETEGDVAVDEDGVLFVPLSLNGIKEAESSSIEWVAIVPTGSTLAISVAVTESSVVEPTTWTQAISGNQIPSSVISSGEDLSNKYLWIRRDSIDGGGGEPRLVSFSAYVEGQVGDCDDPGADWNWIFRDVVIVGGGVENRVRVTVWDYANNIGWDEVIIESTATPEDPAPPIITDARVRCNTGAAGTSDVRLTIRSNTTGGSFNRYKIYRDLVEIADIQRSILDEPFTYYSDTTFTEGSEVVYRAVAVNTEWPGDLTSVNSNGYFVDISSEICSPEIPIAMSATLGCSSAGANNLLQVWGGQDENFRFYDISNPGLHLAQGGIGMQSFSWGHTGLIPGVSYRYVARGCFGDVCSDPTDPPTSSITINDDTCIPPDSSVRGVFDFACAVDGGGNPALAITVKTDHVGDMVNMRTFTDYIVYQCQDSSCVTSQLTEIGRCQVGDEDDCAVRFYPREYRTYHYVVRTYNDVYGLYGDYSTPEFFTVPHICQPGLDMDPLIEAELVCNGNSSIDFRHIDIKIDNHNNDDPVSYYDIYRCTAASAASCETSPFGGCTWDDMRDSVDKICATDEGPADNMTHYYRVDTCSVADCFSLFEDEFVEEEECVLVTPVISWLSASQPSYVCHAPGEEYTEIVLSAGFQKQQVGDQVEYYRSIDGGTWDWLGRRDRPDGQFHVTLRTSPNNRIGTTYYFRARPRSTVTGEIGVFYPLSAPYPSRTITENVCNPTVPGALSLIPVCSGANITSVIVRASGSQYHDEYRIERYNVGSANGSHGEGGSWTDSFTAIAPGTSPTYSYRAVSYRLSDDRTSGENISRSVILDPVLYCGEPFTLSGPGSISVTVNNGGGIVSSGWADITVSAGTGFTGNINFSVSEISNPLSLQNINIVTQNNTISSPYTSNFRFRVEIRDLDYGVGASGAEGARFRVTGTSGSLTKTHDVRLMVHSGGGSVD